MFFNSAKSARIHASIESARTGYRHVVVPCKKYLCYPKLYFGRDYINGFTLVLRVKK